MGRRLALMSQRALEHLGGCTSMRFICGERVFCGERACPALGCEAAPLTHAALIQVHRVAGLGAASQPSAGQARSLQCVRGSQPAS